MTKTIEEWFNELPDGYREWSYKLAIQTNGKNFIKENKADTLADALIDSFVFHRTPQGDSTWWYVVSSSRNNSLNKLNPIDPPTEWKSKKQRQIEGLINKYNDALKELPCLEPYDVGKSFVYECVIKDLEIILTQSK